MWLSYLRYLHFSESWLSCPIYGIGIVFTIWNIESISPAFWCGTANGCFHQESKYCCIRIHCLSNIRSRTNERGTEWNIHSDKGSIFSISLDEVELCSFIDIQNSKYIKIFYELIMIWFFEGMRSFESDSIFILTPFDFSCCCIIFPRNISITLVSWYRCPYWVYPIRCSEFPRELITKFCKKCIYLTITRSKENLTIFEIIMEDLKDL